MTIDSEPPFEGSAGSTRKHRQSFRASDGTRRTVEAFKVLNVREHPHLAHRALAGDLHDSIDNDSNEVSYVYHDPDRRIFALVLAASDVGRELQLRINVLSELAKESSIPPRYVRDLKVVYGAAELRAIADGPIDERRLEQEAARLEAWAEALQNEDASIRERLGEFERSELGSSKDDAEIELDIFDISLEGEPPAPSAVPLAFGEHEVSSLDVVGDLDASDVDDEYSDVTDVRRLESMLPMDNSGLLVQPNLPHADATPSDDFWERAETECSISGTDNGPQAFISVEGSESLAFHDASTEIQLTSEVVEGRPVVVLQIDDRVLEAKRYAYLDPTETEARVTLRALIARPEVLITVYNEMGQSRRAFYVHHRASKLSREMLDRWPPGEEFQVTWEHAISQARRSNANTE